MSISIGSLRLMVPFTFPDHVHDNVVIAGKYTLINPTFICDG